MFNDSLISLMIMLLLCFMGMLVMFLFVIRSLSVQTAVLREGFTRQQSALADLEQQIMDMNFALRKMPRDSGVISGQEGRDVLADAVAGLAPAGAVPGTGGAFPPVSRMQQTAGSEAPSFSPSSDLRGLFTPAGAVSPPAEPAKDYSYPSAAGFGPLEEEPYNITLSPVPGDREKKKEQPSAGLDLKLGN